MLITVQDINHSFLIGRKGKESNVPVLKNISFSVKQGEIVSIVGRSGSGKSTLLHILAGFLKPDSGEIVVKDTVTSVFNEQQSAQFRLENYGFIFQNFQLMPGLTAFENVELPLKLKGMNRHQRKDKVQQLMKHVGLQSVQDHYPNELSGGQQQRVSIARALITDPPIIFADEPTGNLDSRTGADIMNLLQEINRESRQTIIMVTHSPEAAKNSSRIITVSDGMIE